MGHTTTDGRPTEAAPVRARCVAPELAWLVLAVGTAAMALYAAAPRSALGGAAFSLIAMAVPIGIVVGISRNRPSLVRPWALLAAATVTSAVGASVRAGLDPAARLDATAITAHAITLSSYVVLGSALLRLLRARRPGVRDRTSLLDGALVGVSAWVVVWSFLVVPAVENGRDVGLQVLQGAYPTASMVLVYLGIQLALTGTHRVTAGRLLFGCLAVVLAGDLAYALFDAGHLVVDLAVIDAFYGVGFLCGVGAALHPSMRLLTEPQPVGAAMGAARLTAVSSALLAPILAAAVRPPGRLVEWAMLLGSAVTAMGLVVVRIARAVNEHAASEALLAEQATHDALTGLANRAGALRHLDAALAGRVVHGHGTAVLFLDLDRFRDVNDTWGHTTGDRLLVEVGRRLALVLRPGDVLARLGGDEFVAVATPVAGVAVAMTVAARLTAALAEPFDLGVCRMDVSASIGVVHVGAGEPAAAEDMLRDADTAMYRGKDVGGDAMCLFDATMRADVDRRVALEADLRHVVARGELRLHYQPVVDLLSGALIGFEALVRWERPGHGLVPPLEFISAAEDTGAIVAIGAWVLEEGCRQLAAWDAELDLDGGLSLACNLSARQLRDSTFVGAVAAALATSGIAPGRLIVEITESVVLEEVAEVQDALVALRALGVHLAADDFGTGYSSLSYLKRHPIDHVKIDRSFVTGLGTDPDDEGIVAAILAMAKALHLTVVAEGIETPTQRRRLTELGCDHAQGYLFAAPLTTAAAAALIERSVRSGWVPWDADPGDPPGLRELAGDLGAAAKGRQGR